ncbi:NACHT%2C LRR and PYD domains-containing protein 12-like [Xyrichtys novacula]|uniref:NACHT, LRR and PYD domains-containing protein 12-like n=1 Tax=Xyrichtys novacula TaxID=13765 RepID=A0AAV1GKU6_XYRNO|nr:NACHT%2C LRR and PYD domains-containing protein 12-like [Xyrichtys novacula]
MNQNEDTEEGAPHSKITRLPECEALRCDENLLWMQEQRPTSPGPSCDSMKSDQSKELGFIFKGGHSADENFTMKKQRPSSPGPSCISMRSDQSKELGFIFKGGHSGKLQQSSEDQSNQSDQQHQTNLDSIFTLLEMDIVTFVRKELRRVRRALSSDDPSCLESQSEDEEVLDGEDKEQGRSSREAFLKITLHFLKRRKQEELVECLQSSKKILTDFT